MANLEVAETNVPGVIKKLKTSEWLSPLFQRDFVWSTAAVVSLINSIIDARPVGMITLWEQEGDSALPLEPISIPDWDNDLDKTGHRYFGDPDRRTGRFYAILDGRQRSTALALAFGGLRATSGVYRNSGRYYLDVCAADDTERVKFISEKDVGRRNIGTLKSAIASGLFPLEVQDPDTIFDQWMSYIQHIRDPQFYPDQTLPSEVELDRRNRILQKAFNGIIKTKIALYIVPQTYDLADICDIFETLNTTGTKVSTVDLIHSNIYSDTAKSAAGPILLRDKIDELGEHDGAVGWASSKDRPELVAQMVAATHVALHSKPEARAIGGRKDYKIASVKSQDLLAIPWTHWQSIINELPLFAGFIGAFQLAVAGGHFGMNQCPYPASSTIYVALRWHHHFEAGPNIEWQVQNLDNLYRAFFWRNAISTRYDQGFLTQIGTDIKEFKAFLETTKIDEDFDHWRVRANTWLDAYLGAATDFETVYNLVTDGGEAGALKRASHLLLYARARYDVVDSETSISYPSGDTQLHHIFPKDWCANNVAGASADVLNEKLAQRDFINSAANLMPMSRKSNLSWRKKVPAQFLEQEGLTYDAQADLWNAYFVNRQMFEVLSSSPPNPGEFWKMRGRSIAEEIVRRMTV